MYVWFVVLVLVAAACGSSQVAPTGSTGPASPSSETGAAASPGAGTPSRQPPSTGAITPPPAGDPQACLAIVPRADVASALGGDVTDVVAEGTDPSVGLSCTFTTAEGPLLITTSAADSAAGFQTDMDNAEAYGQNPAPVDGIGDQAFYATSGGRYPEELVFTTGPVLVRLQNQTSGTVGQAGLAGLATTVAAALGG
jgi:hypothetical protein